MVKNSAKSSSGNPPQEKLFACEVERMLVEIKNHYEKFLKQSFNKEIMKLQCKTLRQRD